MKVELTEEQIFYVRGLVSAQKEVAFARMVKPRLGDVLGTYNDITTNRNCKEILDALEKAE